MLRVFCYPGATQELGELVGSIGGGPVDEDEVENALDEIVKDIRNPHEEPMVRYTLAQTKIARLQARIAYDTVQNQERLVQVAHDTARSQERQTHNLVWATWGLVVATLVVAAVAIIG
jgi:hypothetical protein